MAPLPIEIIDVRTKRDDFIGAVLAKMNNLQHMFNYTVLGADLYSEFDLLIREDTDINLFRIAAELKVAAWKGYHPFLVYIFDTPIHHNNIYNLFSVNSTKIGMAFITIHEVAEIVPFKTALEAYVIHQLAAYSLKFAGGNLKFHREERFCIYDFKDDKRAMVPVMQSGKICDHCKEQLLHTTKLSKSQFSAVQTLLKFASEEMEKPPSLQDSKPNIFVGSSSEGLAIARAIQSDLEKEYDLELWTQSEEFGLGYTTIEALVKAAEKYDFAIFIFTPDDQITSRDFEGQCARDNVIFEAGMFIGKIGRSRTFIVRPRGVKLQIPSDLHGVTFADYNPKKSSDLAKVGPACNKIRQSISNIISI